MPRKALPAPPEVPAGVQRCAACGEMKPVAAFRRLTDGRRQATCRACRPPLPAPAWSQRARADQARRRGAIREAANRRAEKDRAAAASLIRRPAPPAAGSEGADGR